MSSPARSCSLMTTAIASWNFSRKRTSSMQVSSGRPHMHTSNQRGRGYEPVIVLGRIRLAVAVNMAKTSRGGILHRVRLSAHLEAPSVSLRLASVDYPRDNLPVLLKMLRYRCDCYSAR